MKAVQGSRSSRVSKTTQAKPSIRFVDTGRLKSSSRRTQKPRPKATDKVYRVGFIGKGGKLCSVYESFMSLHAARAVVEGTKLSILYPGDFEGQKPEPVPMNRLKGKAWSNLYRFKELEHEARWPDRYNGRKNFINNKRQFQLFIVLGSDGEVQMLTTSAVHAGSCADPSYKLASGRTVHTVTVTVPKEQADIQPAKVRYPLVAKPDVL